MKRSLSAAALLAAVVLLAGCGNLFDPAAAVVNGEKIPVEEIDAALEAYRALPNSEELTTGTDEGEFARQFEQLHLGRLVLTKILEDEAAERGIEVTDEDIAERTQEIEGQFPSQNALEEQLKREGIPLEILPDLVYLDVLETRMREEITGDEGATEEDLRAYYEENIDAYSQTRASHIIVEDQPLAAQLHERLSKEKGKKLEALFEKLVKEHSIEPRAGKRGGDIGYFSPGEVVPEFEVAASSVDVGEVTPPVRTEFGWHIILITDRRSQPFEEVRDQIYETVALPQLEQEWSEWLTGVYEEADIEVNPRYGELDVETRAILDADADDVPGGEAPSPESQLTTAPLVPATAPPAP